MKTVLLTGYEAFGTTPVNPVEKLALHLDGEEIAGARIAARIIPNTFFKCIDVVKEAMEEVQPHVVLMMGEFGGHLPHLPEVAALEPNLNAPSMSVETMATGLRAAIAAIGAHATDTDDPVPSRLQA